MKILQVVGNSYRIGSGIYSIVNPLVEKLNENNIETNVLYTGTKVLDTPLKLVFQYGKDFKASDFEKYSLIIFHGIYYINYIKLSKILRAKKINYIIKPHSSLMKASFRKHGIRKLVYLLVFFKFFNKAKGIIYTNKDEEINSFKFLNKNRLEEMNGIELFPKTISIHEKTNKTIQLFFLSRIDISHKGVDILLDGIERIIDFLEEENCCISFYGNGYPKSMKYFEERLKSIDSKNVVFKGSIFGEEKEKMYAKSDIFLLTSRYEGFPTVLSETLMYGIPSVITKGTNGKFIFDNNAGWLAKSTKSKDVAEVIKTAIIEYKKQPDYYRENARKLAERTFDINITIDNTIAMYNSFLN